MLLPDCGSCGSSHRPSFGRARFPWWYSGVRADTSLELIFLLFEEHVKGGHRTIAARDVLLHVDLFGVRELVVSVYLLLQDPKLVPHSDDLMKENVQGHFFGL